MVFGANALITKPAVSFAPMITVSILNHHGYEKLKEMSAPPGDSTGLVNADLDGTMFHLLVWTPLLLAILQLIFWSFYTLRDSHKSTKKVISEIQVT
jgi:Na+/melibiose symporter-like transporter